LNPFATSAQAPTGQLCSVNGEWKPLDVEGPVLSARAYLASETIGQQLFVFGGYKPDTMTSSSSMYLLTRCDLAQPQTAGTAGATGAAGKTEEASGGGPAVKGIRFDQRVTVAGTDGEKRQVSFKADRFERAFQKVDDLSPELMGTKTYEEIHDIAIKLFLQPTAWVPPPDGGFPMQRSYIEMLCERVEPILRNEETLVSVRAPVKVFGDIHGQFGDLMSFFREYGSPSTTAPGGDLSQYNYLFLGDYVDRGSHSLETVILLLALKVRHPEKVYLLRGNHESEETNSSYGFLDECEERLGEEEGRKVWMRLNQVFCWLPPAAVVDNQILAVHGGIGTNIVGLQDIRNAARGTSCMDGGQVLIDLMWSDPAEHDCIEGCHDSPRGVSSVFGPDRVKEFLRATNLTCIIRAHQCVQDGFEVFASGHLITVFSATNYCGVEGNSGAICYIGEDGNIQFKIIEPNAGGPDPWLECNKDRPPTPPRPRR